MKRLPKTVSSFERMIEGDYLYVDKTKDIYRLLQSDKYYFVSRPRRFGKTLLISTLKQIFLGSKELFENLWIGTSDYSWTKYPVIHLDFSTIAHRNADVLNTNLMETLDDIALANNVQPKMTDILQSKLKHLVRELFESGPVVILIDEYDYPLLKHLDENTIVANNREILSDFYATIKALDPYLRSVFITGVTRFSKLTLFSGMNNLNDITLKPEAATLLGYTKQEIESYFTPHLQAFSSAKNKDVAAIMEEMAAWYNGYCFSWGDEKVYNPFSILYYLDDQKLSNYWSQSGNPSFLIHLLKEQYASLQNIGITELSELALGTFDIKQMPIISILFQAGYLTISEYNEKTKKYKLAYPNKEVEETFKDFLLTFFANTDAVASSDLITNFKRALARHDIDSFCRTMQSMLAGIPYNHHIEKESYYHSLFQLVIDLLGLEAQSKVHTSKGRIDLTLVTLDHIYVFEFKLNSSPEEALNQIDAQRYAEKYVSLNKEITLVGISFNFEDKRLSLDWKSKRHS